MTPLPSLSHTIWLESQGCAFVYLPKVACTSWKLYLWQALGHSIPAGFRYGDVHDLNKLTLPYVAAMEQQRQSEFTAGIANQKIHLFAMIREPRARILSAYLDKIKHHTNPHSHFSTVVIPAIQRFSNDAGTERPAFATFLAWIASQTDSSLNDHWRPMTSILGTTAASTYTRVWTMDQIHQACEFFNGLFGRSIRFPSSQQLGTRKTHNSHTQIEAYYGEEEMHLFAQIYQHDLTLYQSVRETLENPGHLRDNGSVIAGHDWGYG